MNFKIKFRNKTYEEYFVIFNERLNIQREIIQALIKRVEALEQKEHGKQRTRRKGSRNPRIAKAKRKSCHRKSKN